MSTPEETLVMCPGASDCDIKSCPHFNVHTIGVTCSAKCGLVDSLCVPIETATENSIKEL